MAIVESKIQAKQGWILHPLCCAQPCALVHTHTDTHAVPPLLLPGDVTLLLVGSLIPFLTF